jgi:two-component system NtrC family sensor kinase
MSLKKIRIKLVLLIVTVLFVALNIQTLVVLMIFYRVTIQGEIESMEGRLNTLARQLTSSASTMHPQEFLDVVSDSSLSSSGCLAVWLSEKPEQYFSQCAIAEIQKNSINTTALQQDTDIRLSGSVFSLISSFDDNVIVSIPVIYQKAQFAVLSMAVPVVPFSVRYRGLLGPVWSYIILGTIFFGLATFFRMDRYLIRPVQELVKIAESCTEENDLQFYPGRSRGPFAMVGHSIQRMVERIENDNSKLRSTVSKLQAANSQLKENRDTLVRSEKLASVGRLSAGLAHEIGNPLSIVQGYLDLLGRTDIASSEQQVFVNNARQELERIDALIRQLLDFARPAAAVKERVCINTFIAEIIEFIKIDTVFKGCSVVLDSGPGNDAFVTEKESLKQVILNCLLNAVDAMEDLPEELRQIVVTTRFSQTEEKKTTAVLSIKDRGEGIAENMLDKVFEPFFTTRETGKGTGLGLFVCHTIMERLGGTIRLKNREQGGVEVTITIPRGENTNNGL